ncbi:MAG: hypothetical protein EXX96DRAFT_525650 [Benjaminiella poitrasii]|nr:MAG: hypothetical protein EXX96DRAFT_525650 [Benjaminiella poitrasii]
MSNLDPSDIQQLSEAATSNNTCLLTSKIQLYEPEAEDILTDEDLLDLFRIVKQVLRKNPDSERLAKLLFCMSYALGDHVKFSKPCHEDRIVFRDKHSVVHSVRLPSTSSCCTNQQNHGTSFPTFDSGLQSEKDSVQKWIESSSITSTSSPSPSTSLSLRLPSVSQLATNVNNSHNFIPTTITLNTTLPAPSNGSSNETVMEPQQRGFYYQDGRITREPVLLQRYAEQGILTQASLMRKRKRHSTDSNSSHFELSNLPAPTKKPKIPHRHGEFESRRDDIINRLRTITMADLEQKAQRLPCPFTLAIDESIEIPDSVIPAVNNGSLSQEQLGKLLEPSLHILTSHSNMKPHLDNGMNQNGIYYNSDYFRLYLAFEQFQRTFAILFPNEIVKIAEDREGSEGPPSSSSLSVTEREKDRERNANMKAYRAWIEPLLMETNWAAFRRNIVVGERMMQLAKSIGQGILLMTKELSGSKLHLTFTNSEWDVFITGLNSGKWDQMIEWENGQREQLEQQSASSSSLLVSELRLKFSTPYWFHPDGSLVSSKERQMLIHTSTVEANTLHMYQNAIDPTLLHHT